MTLLRRGWTQAHRSSTITNSNVTPVTTDKMFSSRIATAIITATAAESKGAEHASPTSTTDSSPTSSRLSSLAPTRSSSGTTLTSFFDDSNPNSPFKDEKLEYFSKHYDRHHTDQLPCSLEPVKEKEEKNITLSFDEAYALMPWQMDNPHIRTGYRRPTPSFKGCAWSIFGYLHNETVNILTHLFGAVAFLSLLSLRLMPTLIPSFHPSSKELFDLIPHTFHDKVALTVFRLAVVICLGLSATFHTLSCHSKHVSDFAHRGDYIGIIVNVVGTICPMVYYAFHGQLFWQLAYIIFIMSAGLIAGFIVLSPHHRSNRWHRTLTFTGLGASACIPITHVLVTQGWAHARSVISIDLICMGGGIYVIGGLI
ncbi:hypothetical protein IAT40_000739 [Kwoniella sp. CBS 6097]